MNKKEETLKEIKNFSNRVKKNILEMAFTAGASSSHFGGALSIVDIVSVLFGHRMKLNDDPNWDDRDRFILSKGHAGAGVYATLAESGFIPVKKLRTHYQDGSDLSGHVSHKGIPGVEFSTGSLGHGLPVAAGMALAAKINKVKHNIYVLMSDGECDEGSNWEAALFAPHHKLDNLVVIIDRNKLQSIHSTENTLNLEPFVDKWQAFGWNVVNIDGHNHQKLLDACGSMVSGKPLCIIANTIKGKGVSFMENNNLWHYRSPKGKEYDAAMQELNNA